MQAKLWLLDQVDAVGGKGLGPSLAADLACGQAVKPVGPDPRWTLWAAAGYGHVLANWHWLLGRAWLLLGHAGALGHLGLGRWLGVGALGPGALGSHGLAGGALGCSWLAVGHHGCWGLELVAVAQWSLLGPRAAHTTRFDAGMLQVHKHVLHVCNMTALPQSSHFCSQEHCFGWSCVVTHPAGSVIAMRATPENHGCLENSTKAEFLRAGLLVVLLFLLDGSIGMEDHGPGKNKTRAEWKILIGQGPDALAWSNCWISLA